jgi:hypothetical protein
MTVNPDNLAEQVCRPTVYFKELAEVKVLPNKIEDLEVFAKNAVIFGGSGLFYYDTAPVLVEALDRKRFPMVLWGGGANQHGDHLVRWPEWTKKFDLVGLRDFGNPWDYVPCPSCMSPFFDEARASSPKHDLVVYEHPRCPIDGLRGFPRMDNKHKAGMFRDVLMFLASGRTLVTSSYHGVYWGMLLGRKVLCWKPWSSKFYGLEPLYYLVNDQNWNKVHKDIPKNGRVENYLEGCRQLNVYFAEKVFKLLKL